MRLEEAVPNARLDPPRADLIASAERELGAHLPQQLRALYEQCNGLREALGNASYLWPLFGDTSLVRMTKFFREDYKELAPNAPDFSNYVFFGSSTADENWAIRCTGDPQIILYHYNMGGDFDVIGGDILEVFAADQRAMQELANSR